MADYVMRNSGSALDDAIENYLDKRTGGIVDGDIESTTVMKALYLVAQILEDKDTGVSIDVADLCSANIANIAGNTLPTTDPGITGRLWNDGGIVKVSA